MFRKEIYLEIHREDGTVDEEARAEVNDALGELGRGHLASQAAGRACGT